MLTKLKYGVISALDNPIQQKDLGLVKVIHDIPGIVGFKLSARLCLKRGIEPFVKDIREITDKPLILDGQKFGTDIPTVEENTIKDFVGLIQGIIIFPQSGPRSQEAFIKTAQATGIVPIAGGEMTHSGYTTEEGGYITNIDKMYLNSAKLGVKAYVIPGNKPERIKHYVSILKHVKGVEFFMPGIGRQGGDILSAFRAVGKHPSYAIIGRGIRDAPDPREAALRFVKEALSFEK